MKKQVESLIYFSKESTNRISIFVKLFLLRLLLKKEKLKSWKSKEMKILSRSIWLFHTLKGHWILLQNLKTNLNISLLFTILLLELGKLLEVF
jgi:hypothetical protein